MVLYSPEVKAQRKSVIKSWNYLKTRDKVLGIQPTPPAKVVHHPRYFDAPLSCRSGRHQWFTKALMGVPILKCKKCGRIVMKGSFEGTETKRELRTRHIPDPGPLEPNFEVFE